MGGNVTGGTKKSFHGPLSCGRGRGAGEVVQACDGLADAAGVVAHQGEAFGCLAQVYVGGVGLGIAYHLHEVRGAVEGILLVGDEVAHHAFLFEDEFLDAEVLGHAA